jgi:hypothetical protein
MGAGFMRRLAILLLLLSLPAFAGCPMVADLVSRFDVVDSVSDSMARDIPRDASPDERRRIAEENHIRRVQEGIREMEAERWAEAHR